MDVLILMRELMDGLTISRILDKIIGLYGFFNNNCLNTNFSLLCYYFVVVMTVAQEQMHT